MADTQDQVSIASGSSTKESLVNCQHSTGKGNDYDNEESNNEERSIRDRQR